MPRFDNREQYDNWKAGKALQRLGKSNLERSDREWASKGSEQPERTGLRWLWWIALVLFLGTALYFFLFRR